jgi:hypothetical protein
LWNKEFREIWKNIKFKFTSLFDSFGINYQEKIDRGIPRIIQMLRKSWNILMSKQSKEQHNLFIVHSKMIIIIELLWLVFYTRNYEATLTCMQILLKLFGSRWKKFDGRKIYAKIRWTMLKAKFMLKIDPNFSNNKILLSRMTKHRVKTTEEEEE